MQAAIEVEATDHEPTVGEPLVRVEARTVAVAVKDATETDPAPVRPVGTREPGPTPPGGTTVTGLAIR